MTLVKSFDAHRFWNENLLLYVLPPSPQSALLRLEHVLTALRHLYINHCSLLLLIQQTVHSLSTNILQQDREPALLTSGKEFVHFEQRLNCWDVSAWLPGSSVSQLMSRPESRAE